MAYNRINEGLGGRFGTQSDILNNEMLKNSRNSINLSQMKGKLCTLCHERKALKGGTNKEDDYGVRRFKCKACCEKG